jgi:hypothetical protein
MIVTKRTLSTVLELKTDPRNSTLTVRGAQIFHGRFKIGNVSDGLSLGGRRVMVER